MDRGSQGEFGVLARVTCEVIHGSSSFLQRRNCFRCAAVVLSSQSQARLAVPMCHSPMVQGYLQNNTRKGGGKRFLLLLFLSNTLKVTVFDRRQCEKLCLPPAFCGHLIPHCDAPASTFWVSFSEKFIWKFVKIYRPSGSC